MKKDSVVELFSGSLWEAELLKSIFIDNEIECFKNNSTLSTFIYEPAYFTGVKFMILEEDIERASIILDEFWKNIKK